jgi:hypothetical protein
MNILFLGDRISRRDAVPYLKHFQMRIILSCLLILTFHVTYSQDCFVLVSSGGGITGAATVYKIGRDGKVLKGNGLGEITYNEQGKLKKAVAKKYYRQAKKLVEASPDFNYPGNMYYSVGIIEKDKQSKITWGDTQHPASEEIKHLYQEITKALAALTFMSKNTK